jgi:hypothetical protein
MARINPNAEPRSNYPNPANNAPAGSTTNTATSTANSAATTAATTSNVRPAMSSVAQTTGAFTTQPKGTPTHNTVCVRLVTQYEKNYILPPLLCTLLKNALKNFPPLHTMRDADWGMCLTGVALKFVEMPGLAKLIQEAETKLDSMATEPKILNLDRHAAVPALVRLFATLTDDNRVKRDKGNNNRSEAMEQRIAVFGNAISQTWRDMVFSEPKITPLVTPAPATASRTATTAPATTTASTAVSSTPLANSSATTTVVTPPQVPAPPANPNPDLSIQVMNLDGSLVATVNFPVLDTLGEPIEEILSAIATALESKPTRTVEEENVITMARVFSELDLDEQSESKGKDEDMVQEKKKD